MIKTINARITEVKCNFFLEYRRLEITITVEGAHESWTNILNINIDEENHQQRLRKMLEFGGNAVAINHLCGKIIRVVVYGDAGVMGYGDPIKDCFIMINPNYDGTLKEEEIAGIL